ncbi:MAG TPA: AMP-binding protein [Thermoanaerobaculia bacterium]|nr:AMP-binding protein [Thermoanaerobaculia bacterium]
MFDLDLLSERARVTPDKLALVSIETGERITYAELNARAERAAATLRSLLDPGARFGLLAYNSVEFLELFFAAGKANVIVVPLSTRATEHELRHIAADCGMKLLFQGPDFQAMDLGIPRYTTNWRETTSNQQPATSNSETTYCLLYTSGTTGKPKGVMIPKRQLYWNGYNTAVNWSLREDDVSPIFTPLYHAGGIAAFTIPIFTIGGTMVLHKGFDVSEVWSTIEKERCSVVLGVPTIWKLLMDAPQFATVDLSSVRWFISGGAPLPQYVIDAYQKRGVVFKQGYGMTEVGVNCFTMTVEESFRKPGSIGRPMLFTEVKLENMDGDVGEMWIRGPHVSKGYWNNDAATREAYADDGWFRTGDLARRDEEGFFYIAGRRKEMFISGGVNVYPAEIEAELVSHPLVSDAAVVAVPDDTWGEVGVAFIVGTTDGETLAQYLGTRLSKYKVPRRFVFVDALPRTPYGKVVKEELRRQLS